MKEITRIKMLVDGKCQDHSDVLITEDLTTNQAKEHMEDRVQFMLTKLFLKEINKVKDEGVSLICNHTDKSTFSTTSLNLPKEIQFEVFNLNIGVEDEKI